MMPLTFTPDDAGLIGRILKAEVSAVFQGAEDAPALVPLGD